MYNHLVKSIILEIFRKILIYHKFIVLSRGILGGGAGMGAGAGIFCLFFLLVSLSLSF